MKGRATPTKGVEAQIGAVEGFLTRILHIEEEQDSDQDSHKMKSQIEIHNKGKRGIRIRIEVTRIHNPACDKSSGGIGIKNPCSKLPFDSSLLRIYAISCVTQRLSPLSIAAFLSL
jgi:hypothetical protein